MNQLFRILKTSALVGILAIAGGACTGADGADGTNGSNGTDGTDGSDGSNGHNALVTVTDEAAGDNCEFGGQKIESGLDLDDDGVLDADEVENTIYVCNGGPGASGLDTLVSVTDEPAGENCAEGGQKIETGVDDNDNGVLDAEEVDSTEYVCNGENLIPSSGESCSTCHGTDKSFDVADYHPDNPPTFTVTITRVARVGDALTVYYTLTDEDDDGVAGIPFADCRFMLADLVPADDTAVNDRVATVTATDSVTVADLGGGDFQSTWVFANGNFTSADVGIVMHITGTANGNDGFYQITAVTNSTTIVTNIIEDFTGTDETFAGTETLVIDKAYDTPYFEQWAYERSSNGGTFTDLGGGDYSYTWDTTLADIDPLDAPDFDIAHTQRVFVRVDGRDHGYNRHAGFMDVTLPTSDGDATPLAPQRVLAPTDGCKTCHSDAFQQAAHAGGYQDTRACVMCHSERGPYGWEMQESGAEFNILVHKIHAAKPMEAFANRIGGRGYEAVTYPQDVRDCAVCHTGNENMVTDSWSVNPTMEACGSCHDGVNFATGEGHNEAGGINNPGPQTSNDGCGFCHNSTTIKGYHAAPAPAAADVPEFDVTIAITGASGDDGEFLEGDTVTVTVTLAAADGGAAADYTAAADDANDRDGVLTEADLVVYGPRSQAVSVLGGGGDLMLPTTDSHVQTTSSGFIYVTDAIPAGMAPGTYLVRFEGGDYGVVDASDYVTHSSAVASFQVGTATVEPKAAGDACLGCHGDTRMHLQGAHPHNAAFDTDECLACHNYTPGNYGAPISNRVHAVHSANSGAGDMYNILHGSTSRDWEEVTYPSNIDNCQMCHNSGSDEYKTEPAATPCAGCHVEEDNTVLDHLRQNGGGF